jgi:hypothetical protein
MNIDNPKPAPIIYDKRKYTFEHGKPGRHTHLKFLVKT